VRIGIEDVSLVIYENWDRKNQLFFQHELKYITRLAFLNSDVATFFYAVRDMADENNVHCHVYNTTQPDEVRTFYFILHNYYLGMLVITCLIVINVFCFIFLRLYLLL